MDGNRFDSLTRTFARQSNRRRFVGIIAAGFGAAALPGQALAQRCRGKGATCNRADKCCDRFVCAPSDRGPGICTPCESGVICDRICCPPDATGCTSIQLPDGPAIGCLCPDGAVYDFQSNACLRAGECVRDEECADHLPSELAGCYAPFCNAGVCDSMFACPEGQVCRAIDGVLTCADPGCSCKSCCACLSNSTCAFTAEFTGDCTSPHCAGYEVVEVEGFRVCGSTGDGWLPCSSTAECPWYTWCNPATGMCDTLCSW